MSAKVGVLAMAEQVDQALARPDLPAVLVGPAAYAPSPICFIIVSWPWLTAPKK